MTANVYTVRDVARIFSLTESRLRYWASTGFINPSGRAGGRRAYTFNDLIEIRAARELLDAGVPLQRVRRSLRALREALPGERQPLARMHVQGDGDNIVVTDERATFDPASGQLLIDFAIGELDQRAAEICQLRAPPSRERPTRGRISRSAPEDDAGRQLSLDRGDDEDENGDSAYAWFLRGCAHDDEADRDPEQRAAARAAYLRALELDPSLASAHTNLGNLYYATGELELAARCYQSACALDPDQAEARYNLANIYEEEGDLDMAIAEYRRALRSRPDFRDAHFNLALTLEGVGGRLQAINHWRRFLDLSDDEPDGAWRQIAEAHLSALLGSP